MAAKNPNSTERIITLFTEIETDNTKRDRNFEIIKDIIDNRLEGKENNIETVADELKQIYDSVIAVNPDLKGWVDDFFTIHYEKASNIFIPNDYSGDESDYEEMGGGRKTKKSKRSRKSKKSKKSRKSKKSKKSRKSKRTRKN